MTEAVDTKNYRIATHSVYDASDAILAIRCTSKQGHRNAVLLPETRGVAVRL